MRRIKVVWIRFVYTTLFMSLRTHDYTDQQTDDLVLDTQVPQSVVLYNCAKRTRQNRTLLNVNYN